MTTLEMSCRLALALVFLIAATSKTVRRGGLDGFARAIQGFGIPKRRVVVVAAVVVAVEVSIMVLLALLPAIGYLVALFLLSGFTAVITRALRHGRSVACRCFGASETPISRSTVVRNAVLAVLAVAGLICRCMMPPAPIISPPWLAALIGLIAGLLLTRWDDLTFLITSRPPQQLSR
jgi:hypothetical protein